VRTALARIWNRSPAVFSFAILAVQVWIPFSARNFQTGDGSSYVYNAIVARDLLFNPHSPYSSVYQFRHALVPNWGGTILLNIILCFAPPEYAQKFLMSGTILIGFLCVSYLIRSLAPRASPWTPLTNFVLQNFLLWCGMFDFILATMAALLIIGYYTRHAGRMTIRGAAILCAGLVGVFLIHLMGAAIALLGLAVLAIWRWMVEPERPDWRQVSLVGAVMVPTIVFALAFAASSGKPAAYSIAPFLALAAFPLNMFNTAGGMIGKQSFLWPVVLAAIVLVIWRLSRAEWKSVRGGIAMVAIASFIAYLGVPDQGFGGGQAKERFVLSFFIFGAVLVSAARQFATLRIGLALYVSIFLSLNLIATTHALSAYSAAIGDYLSAVGPVSRGSRILRVNYPTPDLPIRYGYAGLKRDPVLRVDSDVAARCRCIDLTDYQALNYIFPIVMRLDIDLKQQDRLWHDTEKPGHATEETRWLHENALGRIDYVILVVDRFSEVSSRNFLSMIANLNEMGMHLTDRSRQSTFVRVYAREEQ
jgi:hypothetical protein